MRISKIGFDDNKFVFVTIDGGFNNRRHIHMFFEGSQYFYFNTYMTRKINQYGEVIIDRSYKDKDLNSNLSQ